MDLLGRVGIDCEERGCGVCTGEIWGIVASCVSGGAGGVGVGAKGIAR